MGGITQTNLRTTHFGNNSEKTFADSLRVFASIRMTPQRYAEIPRLCQAALELNASQRAAFLSQACLDDDDVRAEVEALLAADEAENNLIDWPALEVAAQIFVREQPALTGQRLGNYQILSPLGAGSMGEVYLAEDTRLKRKVALKLLPNAFTEVVGKPACLVA